MDSSSNTNFVTMENNDTIFAFFRFSIRLRNLRPAVVTLKIPSKEEIRHKRRPFWGIAEGLPPFRDTRRNPPRIVKRSRVIGRRDTIQQ
ncbi:hypothetical protein QE152_g31037 [Popillia japonica]|uniref:Uncharacterized protein n=1 Tax=Popillia japonica TaxID=7064 RepID=A0AAW1JCD0_POPJA